MIGIAQDKMFGSTMAPRTIPYALAGKVLPGDDGTGALDPMLCPVKGYNGSISWGLLFKPHGWLKLILLAIFIDITTL